MKKNLYLAILVVTIIVTHFILPASVFVENPRLSIIIPFFISIFSFGGYLSENEEIKDHLIKFDENGKENNQNFIVAIVVSLFVFIAVYAFNQSRAENKLFKTSSVSAEGVIIWANKKFTENNAKITVKFNDKQQKEHEGIAEFEVSNTEFYKYAIGKKVEIKYLPNNPEIIKIVDFEKEQ
jgi:hypothetical protein